VARPAQQHRQQQEEIAGQRGHGAGSYSPTDPPQRPGPADQSNRRHCQQAKQAKQPGHRMKDEGRRQALTGQPQQHAPVGVQKFRKEHERRQEKHQPKLEGV